jgi:hypothetical protein
MSAAMKQTATNTSNQEQNFAIEHLPPDKGYVLDGQSGRRNRDTNVLGDVS